MFEFFIALFGGLFYTGKILSDKSKINKAEHDFNERAELDKAIRKDVEASYEQCEAVKNKLLSGKFIDEVYKELEDDFKFVYGDDFDITKGLYLCKGQKMPSSMVTTECRNRKYYWAYNLLLSHQGKADWDAFAFGFILGGIQTVEDDIRFCQRIEQNLNDNGVGLKLYLNPKYSTYTKSYDYSPCAKYMVFEHQLVRKEIGKRLW